MNADWNEFERLADLARREPVPAVDVVRRVAESITPRVRRPETAPIDWPLVTASAVSVAAALLVMGLASHQGVLSVDPLAELFQPLIPVIQ